MSAAFIQPHRGLELIPGYVLRRMIGKGAFGEVWRAIGPGGFPVALKILDLHAPTTSPELRALELMKNVRHANLLSLSGCWRVSNLLVLAMDLADKSLLQRLEECQQKGLASIPLPELLGYMHDAAKGLDFLNESRHTLDGKQRVSIQHRDVKPANLLLVGNSVKVGDFGLAKLQDRSVVPHSGGLTVAYAAPEFFKDQTSHFSDQYSLAASYFHLRTGRLLFDGSLEAMVVAHLKKTPDLSMLPAAERAVLARALAKTPESRWPNCRAFAEALQVASRNIPVPPPIPVPVPRPIPVPVPIPDPEPRRDDSLSAACLLLGALSLLAMAVGALLAVLVFARYGQTDGIVTRVEMHTRPGDANPGRYVVVQYSVDGMGRGPFECGGFLPYREGDHVPVCYDKSQPSYGAIIGERWRLLAGPLVPILIGVSLGLVSAVLRNRRRRFQAAAVQLGPPLPAKSINVMKNLLALIGIGFVLFVVLSWYLGWFRPVTQPGADDHRNINFELNPKKAAGDVKSGEQKAMDLIGKPPAGNALPDGAFKLPPLPPPQKEITNSIGMKLTYIPPGRFMMGSPVTESGRAENEKQHEVEIDKGFYMGVYAVTQEEYETVMGVKRGYRPDYPRLRLVDDNSPEGPPPDMGRYPVENVTWVEACEFCRKLSERDARTYRLPTEREWEYACRAGTTTSYYFGETISTDQANYNRRRPTKVGSFPANAWGLFDMHGNVWQWCSNLYENSGDSHGVRGGSFARFAGSGDPTACRSASRWVISPGYTTSIIGFRVVSKLP